MRNIVLIIILAYSLPVLAQHYSISGTIYDAKSGETLINATVWVENTLVGCVSNVYGFYSLQLEQGEYTIVISYVGYKPVKQVIKLTKNISLNPKLNALEYLEEVTIKGERNILLSSRMSSINVNMEQTKKTPTIMGEADVFKLMQLSPGVEGGTEGSSGLYVRGGDNGQNLMLIDGIPVYNVSHLMGYISVFNPEAIRKTELLKGGIPASYGGRASSVVDVRMKEGNANKLKGTINVSTLMAGGLIEGPIGEKTGFMFAGRRTILDPFYSSFNNAQTSYDMLYSCWDINAKLNHRFNDNDRIYGSFFTGFDHARSKADEQTFLYAEKNMLPDNTIKTDTIRVTKQNAEKHKWGNVLGAMRWNHIFGSKLFSNTSVTYTNYYNRHGEQQIEKGTYIKSGNGYSKGHAFKSASDIEDYAFLFDFDWFASNIHSIKFGGQGVYHRFRPTVQFDSLDYSMDFKGLNVTKGIEGAIYIEDMIKFGRFEINIGIRNTVFNINNTTFSSFEPRLSACFNIWDNTSLKASYTQADQYIHLISSSSVGFSTDYWVPVSNLLAPEGSQQLAGGCFVSTNNGIDIQVEGYYKKMHHVIEFRDDKVFTMEDQEWQTFMLSGKGWAYGIETSIKKSTSKITGNISYTWSRSWRQFEKLNKGEKYPFKYDRPHNLTLVAMYMPNQKVDYGINWILASGYNYSFNKERIGRNTTYYGKNNMRYPMYHRLDVGVNLHKQKKYGQRTWRFGAYNAYNQMNVSYYRFGMTEGGGYTDSNGNYVRVEPEPTVTRVTLFPIIPYISYRYAFGEK